MSASIVLGSFGGTKDSILALAAQGNQILAGGYSTQTNQETALARFNADGTIDSAFGTAGLVLGSFGGVLDAITAVAVDANGKIVVAGYTQASTAPVAVVARFNANGTLDTGFGTAGIFSGVFGGSTFDQAYCLVIEASGRIIVGGTRKVGPNQESALAGVTTAGALDAAFGSSGLVIGSFGGNNDFVYALALDTSGRIYAAGTSTAAITGVVSGVVARYSATGTLDGGYGIAGILTSTVASSWQAIVIDASGNAIVGGIGAGTASALSRYLPTSSIDTTFGTGGTVLGALMGVIDKIYTVALFGTNILVGGQSQLGVYGYPSVASVVTLTPAGLIYDGYLGGIVVNLFNSLGATANDSVYAVLVQSASAFVAAGQQTTISADGQASKGFTGGSTATIQISTSLANDIVVLEIYQQNGLNAAPTVASVSGGGLTWAKRSSVQDPNASHVQPRMEVWWALATTPLSAVNVTVTLAATTGTWALNIFGVPGLNTSSPWDPNSSLPGSSYANSGQPPNITFSTTDAPTILLAFFGDLHNPPCLTTAAPIGFQMLAIAGETGSGPLPTGIDAGAAVAFSPSSYPVFNDGVSWGNLGGSSGPVMIIDALVGTNPGLGVHPQQSAMALFSQAVAGRPVTVPRDPRVPLRTQRALRRLAAGGTQLQGAPNPTSEYINDGIPRTRTNASLRTDRAQRILADPAPGEVN